jgi:hypothetical protein
MNQQRDLDWSDVEADAAQMMAEQRHREHQQDRLKCEYIEWNGAVVGSTRCATTPIGGIITEGEYGAPTIHLACADHAPEMLHELKQGGSEYIYTVEFERDRINKEA